MEISWHHQETEEPTDALGFNDIFCIEKLWPRNVPADDDNVVRGQDTVISRLQPGIIPNYKSHGERA